MELLQWVSLKEKKVSNQRTYQNTCSVVLQQFAARIAFVVSLEEAFRIPNIEARIVFFFQVITLGSNTVHSSKIGNQKQIFLRLHDDCTV